MERRPALAGFADEVGAIVRVALRLNPTWRPSDQVGPSGGVVKTALRKSATYAQTVSETDLMAAQAIAVSAERSPDSLVEIATDLYAGKRHQEALAILDAVLAANPTLATALCRRATVLIALGRDREALRSADQAITSVVDDPNVAAWARCVRSHILCSLGQYELGLEAADQALGLKSSDHCAQSNRSWALRGLGRLDEALVAAREAALAGPHEEEPHRRMSEVLVEMGQYEEALDEIETALRIEPDNDEALAHREVVRGLLGG
jgi:tetratricopeptide (TPR) repeat protein